MRRLTLLFVVLLFLTALASGQDYPKAEAYFGYSYVRAVVSGATATNMHGWGGEANFNVTRYVGVMGSISGHYKSLGGADLNMYHFLFGPQFTYHSTDSKLQPFGRVMFGASRASAGFSGLAATDTSFSWGFGGGVDVNLTDHIGVRVFSADYIQTRFANDAQNNVRLSFGIKIH